MGFIDFMPSNAGRVVRIVADATLMGIGLLVMKGTGGVVLAIVGLAPLAAGIFDFCIFAPLAGLPFLGSAIRARTGGR